MNRSAIVMAIAAFGISALGCTSAFADNAAVTAVPIQVTNLQYTPDIYGADDRGEPPSNAQPGLMLTFKNVTSRPAHAVTFAIDDASGYQLGTVSRHGTFSPGVEITRYFGDLRLKDKHGLPVKAVPVEVSFTDGTTWSSSK